MPKKVAKKLRKFSKTALRTAKKTQSTVQWNCSPIAQYFFFTVLSLFQYLFLVRPVLSFFRFSFCSHKGLKLFWKFLLLSVSFGIHFLLLLNLFISEYGIKVKYISQNYLRCSAWHVSVQLHYDKHCTTKLDEGYFQTLKFSIWQDKWKSNFQLPQKT